jgi:hypothetical protein
MELILLNFFVTFIAKKIDQVLKMGIGMGNYFGNKFTFRPNMYEGR